MSLKLTLNTLGKRFEKIYELSKKYNIPTLDTETAFVLKSFIIAKRPSNILEIGCGAGASTEILNYSSDILVDAVDANHVRIDLAKENFRDYPNVRFHLEKGEDFLKNCDRTYDFVFVDSIKRHYQTIFHLLRDKLEKNALVVFDDFMFYGYFLQKDCEIPLKYLPSVRELREFYREIEFLFPYDHVLLNIGNGMLVINYAC